MHLPRPHTAGWLGCLACLALPALASAQNAQLTLPSFESLRQRASESVDLTLGALPLHLAAWFMDDHDPDSAEVKNTLKAVKSLQIRSYKFDSDVAYPHAEIDAVRSQLSRPGWTRLVQVHKRGDEENVDIYVALEDHTIKGIAILACEPHEFTILNVVGSVDLDSVARLRRTFIHADHDQGSLAERAP
jgi:Domain of unknown function (DUF4252)